MFPLYEVITQPLQSPVWFKVCFWIIFVDVFVEKEHVVMKLR